MSWSAYIKYRVLTFDRTFWGTFLRGGVGIEGGEDPKVQVHAFSWASRPKGAVQIKGESAIRFYPFDPNDYNQIMMRMIGWRIGTKTQGQDRILESAYHAWYSKVSHLYIICSPISLTAAKKAFCRNETTASFANAGPALFGQDGKSAAEAFLIIPDKGLSLYLFSTFIILTFFKISYFHGI